MKIVSGKVNAPIKAVIYGPEGIGKTTLASKWPAPLFIDCEGGTNRMAVDRVDTPKSFAAVEQAVEELTRNAMGYKTLILDTADWLEKMMVDSVCSAAGKKCIEDFGYGKGYTHLADTLKGFLDKLTRMQAANGMHVVFLAHAAMRKQELPDESGSFDRWELKTHKTTSPIFKEWADLVLFLNYKTLVAEIDGKKKAQGGQRVMHTSHHSCWDAKNRFGLAEELPMDFAKLAPIFADVAAAPKPTEPKPSAKDNPDLMPVTNAVPVAASSLVPAPVPATTTAPVAPPAAPASTAPAPAPVDPEKEKLLVQLKQLMTDSGVTKTELGAQMAKKGIVPADMSPRDYNIATLSRVIAGWNAIKHNIMTARSANNQEQKAA